MSRVAVFPGSFDPTTLAHQDVLEQARRAFDKVRVVIAKNDSKRGHFTPLQRKAMWSMALERGHDVEIVDALVGTCVVDWAEDCGAQFVVRGIRDASDVMGEQTYRRFVRSVSNNQLDVVYFMVPPQLQHVSSSAARQILALRKGDALAGWLDTAVIGYIRSTGAVD